MVCQNFSFKSTGFFCKPIDLLLKLSLNFDHLCIMTLRSLIISILKSSVLLLVKHCIGVIKVRRIPNPQKVLVGSSLIRARDNSHLTSKD